MEPGTTPNRMDYRKAEKPQRTPLTKSNVVSQISNAIGKHTSGLSSDVLSKFASRTRNRPKDDLVSQLEEVCCFAATMHVFEIEVGFGLLFSNSEVL